MWESSVLTYFEREKRRERERIVWTDFDKTNKKKNRESREGWDGCVGREMAPDYMCVASECSDNGKKRNPFLPVPGLHDLVSVTITLEEMTCNAR